MKTLLALILFLPAAAFGAITATNILPSASYNGTATTGAFPVTGTLATAPITVQIAHAAPPSTNAFLVRVQVSLDGTNFVTASTYVPASTNAVGAAYVPSFASLPVYLRLETVTTNANTANAILIKQ